MVDKKSVVCNFFEEVWNKGNVDLIDELYTEDFRLNALWQNTSLGGSGTAGKEEAKGVIRRWLDGFPDMHVTVEEQLEEGDIVVSRHVAVATHTNPFMGMAPTNKRGSLSGITITRLRSDRVSEVWTCWDAVGMMMQLGLAPSPPQTGDPEDTDAAWAAHKQLPEGGDAETSKQVVQRFYRELWSEGKLEVADELFHPDFIGHAPGNQLTRGPEGVKALVASWREGVPDMTLEVHAQHAEGSRCATRFTGRGTHEGVFLGVPPTGKEVSMSGIAITRIIDGQVVSDWGEFDVLGLLQQMGVVPPNPAAGAAPGALRNAG